MRDTSTTREKIQESALEMFAERGYHGTTVPAVAEEAGVGAGTIYRHFDGKKELVNAVFRDAKSRLWETLGADLDLSESPRDLFDTFWDRLTQFARDNPATFRFLELHYHADYLDDESLAIEEGMLGDIHDLCVSFADAGVLSEEMPPEGFMAFVWGALVGIFRAGDKGYLEPTDDILDAARDGCWRAFTNTEETDSTGGSR